VAAPVAFWNAVLNLNTMEKPLNIDLNTPVTNDDLKKAISDFRSQNIKAYYEKLLVTVKRANFLAIIYNDELEIATGENGQTIMKQGSLLKFHLLKDNAGHLIFPLFTDWEEIKLLIKDLKGIGGIVMPADQAYNFILTQPSYFSAVINPASDNWILGRPQLEGLLKLKL